MISNNEKLALARAVYGEAWLTFEDFNPERIANQCHECWDKLVTPVLSSDDCDPDAEIRFFSDEVVCMLDFGIVSASGDTMFSAMTAAMVQLPAVQTLLKEIEE